MYKKKKRILIENITKESEIYNYIERKRLSDPRNNRHPNKHIDRQKGSIIERLKERSSL